MAAVRVCFTWLGLRKTLTADQKDQAAEGFGAQREYLSAGKKLLDTSHPAFKAVTAIRHRAIAYWRGISLPYPEAGIRLIRDPRKPRWRPLLDIQFCRTHGPSWRHFLDLAYWNVELGEGA
mgnify:CR=1 FL=1